MPPLPLVSLVSCLSHPKLEGSLRAFWLGEGRRSEHAVSIWPKQISEFHITIFPIPRVLFLKQKTRIHAFFTLTVTSPVYSF